MQTKGKTNKEIRRQQMSSITFLAIAALVMVGGLSAVFLKNDNPIEEACEQVIKEATGIDVDLTPNSPENVEDKENVSE